MLRLGELLQRMISARRYYTDSREYALSLLLKWEGTSTCRLAVESIVSCAIRARSILHGRALEWVGRKRENRLVHACLLDISKRSAARRSEVLHLMDGCGVELLPPARSVWQAMKETTLSWSHIAKACGAGVWWENFPAEEILFKACLAVMEDNPEEDFPVILEGVLSHDIAGMPELREQIVSLVLDTPEIASVVARHAGDLAKELARLLIDARDPEEWAHYEGCDKSPYANAIGTLSYALARFLSQCKEFSPAQRRAVDLLLTGRPCRPWIGACGALLAPLASSPGEKVHFLAMAWRGSFIPEAVDASLELETFICHLPSEEKVAFVQQILTLGSSVTSLRGILGLRLFRQIAEDATVYTKILVGVLKHVSPGCMLEYLDHTSVGVDVSMVHRWTDGLPSDIHLGRDQEALRLLEVLHKMGCPMRAFLPCHARELLEAGYELCPDDLRGQGFYRDILKDWREVARIWENKQWRDVLLQCSPGTVVSFIACAEARRGNEDSVEWAADILFPLCDESPELWQALIDVAWGKELSAFTQFLVLQRGMSVEETARARAAVEASPWQWLGNEYLKRGVFEKLFSLDEQRDIFFAHVEKEYLPQPAHFEDLFSGEDARKRLLEALRTRYDQGNGNSARWAEWVKYFGFADEEGMRDRLAHTVLSPNARREEVNAALAALGL